MVNYIYFSKKENKNYTIAILHKNLEANKLKKYYINDLKQYQNNIIACSLYKEPKRTPAIKQKEYLTDLEVLFQHYNVQHLIVCDSDYFKTITGLTNVEVNLGYVKQSKCKKYTVSYCPSYLTAFYDLKKFQEKKDFAINSILDFFNQKYIDPGSNIIHSKIILNEPTEVKKVLDTFIKNKTTLTADIETYSLNITKAGFATIALCTDQHNGYVIDCRLNQKHKTYNLEIINLLKNFFTQKQNKIIWHNASYDVCVLIYTLYIKDNSNYFKGLLKGLNILADPEYFEDTKIIAYLATNSCGESPLGLKKLSHEFSGNYSIDGINDITQINFTDLCTYNLIDGLSTWYVYNKYYSLMVQDKQEKLYKNYFKHFLKDIIHMQLIGLPVNMNQVKNLNDELQKKITKYKHTIYNSDIVKSYNIYLKEQYVIKKNSEWKVKRITFEEVTSEMATFNVNSSTQLIELLYGSEFMNLPIINTTAKGNPETGANTLELLLNHNVPNDYKLFIEAVYGYKKLNKIFSDFLPIFLNADYKNEFKHHFLHGGFNLGGTVSGRLSSSKPNLQNLPSTGTKYAKVVKECFQAPEGYIFVGADFSSLEDRISALQTKDPNKIKVYTDNYDGHCLRAYSYFSNQMPDIDPDSIESINSIKDKYPHLRQLSKVPTFALTYAGTWTTLVKNAGLTKKTAIEIEKAYHELYSVSDKWVENKLKEATKTGFVELAFGLKLRTPILNYTVTGNKYTPHLASAEGRTAGNALGQSYGLLTNRACMEFMNQVRNSQYKYDIHPVAQIHDAIYLLIKEDINILKYTNDNLIKAMNWQDDPNIYHDKVKLDAELAVYYPNWSSEIILKNNISTKEIYNTINK